MAALERPVPSPEAFLGQPWAAWVREAAPPHAHGAAPPHSKGRDRPAARRVAPLPAAHARPGHGSPPHPAPPPVVSPRPQIPTRPSRIERKRRWAGNAARGPVGSGRDGGGGGVGGAPPSQPPPSPQVAPR